MTLSVLATVTTTDALLDVWTAATGAARLADTAIDERAGSS